MRNAIAILAAASTLLVACERESPLFAEPKLAADRVLKVAADHMSSKGTVMSNYELDGLSYDYVDRRWAVFYAGRALGVGDHFTVLVSDQDPGKVEVVPGL
jgi:hypothetical protein